MIGLSKILHKRERLGAFCKFPSTSDLPSGKLTDIAGWKMDPDGVDGFPIKNGGFSSQLC